MSADLAKQAAAARADLEAALTGVANTLAAAAAALAACSVTLQEAAERENRATGAYVASLEARISLQQSPS